MLARIYEYVRTVGHPEARGNAARLPSSSCFARRAMDAEFFNPFDPRSPEGLIYQFRNEHCCSTSRDFELLIDLILARTGWVRVAKLGGVTEGTDIEAENAATNEIVFVQVKSEACEHVLADYVKRFQARRELMKLCD